jgi:hypothetical protein
MWSMQCNLSNSEFRTELTSCGPNIEHRVAQLTVLLYSVATKRVTINRQRSDLYKRLRCTAGHGSRAVWGMYCLRSLASRDRGFGSHARHGCLVCVCVYSVCVVLCLRRGLATSWSLVRGVLPSVKWSWNWDIGPMIQSGSKRGEKIRCSGNVFQLPVV